MQTAPCHGTIAVMSEELLSRTPPPADERIAYGPEASQFIDLRRGPGPLVVCLHGGYWRARYDLTHLGHLCAGLTAHGFTTANVEYRRLGEPGVGFPEMAADLRDALALLSSRFGARRPVVLGHSAGGHLALWAGREGLSSSVVALAPVSDLAEASRLGLSNGVTDELLATTSLEAASPAHRLPAGCPVTILHGTADDTVPFAMSEAFARRASAAGDDVRLVPLEGLGHYEPIDPSTGAFRSVVEALRTSASSTGARHSEEPTSQ
jgi:acetyl esterase/lipase